MFFLGIQNPILYRVPTDLLKLGIFSVFIFKPNSDFSRTVDHLSPQILHLQNFSEKIRKCRVSKLMLHFLMSAKIGAIVKTYDCMIRIL